MPRVLNVPLRIAVTGHRQIEPADRERLLRAVQALFTQLAERVPGVGVELVSGMADGADRIAAQAALAAGMTVHALLPMPLDMYLADFDEASRKDLRTLLADPRVHTTELELPPGMDRAAASRHGPERDALYVALAERLQVGTSILLALWDGEDLGLPGGTGDTVLRYLGLIEDKGRRKPQALALPAATAPAMDGERPVFWLRTRRPGSPSAHTETAGFLGIAHDGEVVVTGRQLPLSLAAELDRLVDYASDSAAHGDPGGHAWGLSLEEAIALRPAAAESLRRMDYEYRRADQLAIYHQQRSDRLFRAFSLMAALMGFLFLVYAKLSPGKVFLAGYIVLFGAGFLLFSVASRNGWFSRHLMYRAIAESLRTRFYLTVAGIEPRGVAQHLMTLLGVRRIPGFSWIGLVLRACAPMQIGTAPDPDACLEWVRKSWIDDQHRYFERKAHAMHRAHHRLERFKAVILAVMAIAIVVLMFMKDFLTNHVFAGLPLKTHLVFLLGLVPFWLGVWEIYQAKMAVKELGWQYQNQLYHLDRASAALQHPVSPARVVEVLDETAERLLADTYLWIVQRFHREHEPPAAG